MDKIKIKFQFVSMFAQMWIFYEKWEKSIAYKNKMCYTFFDISGGKIKWERQ
mgnify:CR=1 FL=1